MTEQNFSGQSWPPSENQSIGTGEGESPLVAPQTPRVDVRTINSDLNSIKETGGSAPRSYTPPQAEKSDNPTPAPRITPESSSIFQPPQIERNEPPASFPKLNTAPGSKKLFWIILAVIVIIGLGVAGYFFVYPALTAKPALVSTPAAETPTPQTQEVPTVPEATPVTPVIQTPPAIIHASFFKSAADLNADIALPEPADLTEIKKALDFKTADVPIFKEVVLKDDSNAVISLEKLLMALLPNALSANTVSNLELDFTAFVYTDPKGSWPGYVFRAKASATLADLQTQAKEIEKSSNLANLFVTDPGAQSMTWKTGQTSGVTNSYLAFSKTGFAVNYGWVGDKLLISTSYDGFKEAIKRLQ